MALPALLFLPDTTWTPGDPLYDPPEPEQPRTRHIAERLRDGGGLEMRWAPDHAVPAPWGWLCGDAATGRCSR